MLRHSRWQVAVDLVHAVAEAGAVEGFQVDEAVAALVEAGVNGGFGGGGFGVELHGVRFDAHDGADVGGEEGVRDLGEHGIGKILDHQGHAMGLGPAGAEDGAGLGFAGFEGNAVPAELASDLDHAPVVCTFVEEERFAGGDTVDIDRMFLEFVGEWLFDVEEHSIKPRVLVAELIEHGGDVARIGDGAVKIGGEPLDIFVEGDLADFNQPVVIPGGVVAAEFYFQAFQAVALDPVGEENGVAIFGLRAGEFGRIKEVKAANKVPGAELRGWAFGKEVGGVTSAERNLGAGGGGEKFLEVAVEEVGGVGAVGGTAEEIAEGVMDGNVEEGAADEGGEPGNRLGPCSFVAVEIIKHGAEDLFLEVPADFERVSPALELSPGLGQTDREIFKDGVALFVREFAGPDPLNAQRCFAPAGGTSAMAVFDRDFGTSARDGGGGFGAELEWDAGLDREEIEFGGDDADVGRFGHVLGRNGIGNEEGVNARDGACRGKWEIKWEDQVSGLGGGNLRLSGGIIPDCVIN